MAITWLIETESTLDLSWIIYGEFSRVDFGVFEYFLATMQLYCRPTYSPCEIFKKRRNFIQFKAWSICAIVSSAKPMIRLWTWLHPNALLPVRQWTPCRLLRFLSFDIINRGSCSYKSILQTRYKAALQSIKQQVFIHKVGFTALQQSSKTL